VNPLGEKDKDRKKITTREKKQHFNFNKKSYSASEKKGAAFLSAGPYVRVGKKRKEANAIDYANGELREKVRHLLSLLDRAPSFSPAAGGEETKRTTPGERECRSNL